MATKKLKITNETDMFGTKVWFETKDGTKRWLVADGLSYDVAPKLAKKMDGGYLFRSPNTDPTLLSDIWETFENFTGQVHLTSEYDDKSDNVTTFARIKEKGDATMFAFAHNTFEKWSDEKEAEEKARAKERKKVVTGTVNDDGTVRVTIETEVLGD